MMRWVLFVLIVLVSRVGKASGSTGTVSGYLTQSTYTSADCSGTPSQVKLSAMGLCLQQLDANGNPMSSFTTTGSLTGSQLIVTTTSFSDTACLVSSSSSAVVYAIGSCPATSSNGLYTVYSYSSSSTFAYPINTYGYATTGFQSNLTCSSSSSSSKRVVSTYSLSNSATCRAETTISGALTGVYYQITCTLSSTTTSYYSDALCTKKSSTTAPVTTLFTSGSCASTLSSCILLSQQNPPQNPCTNQNLFTSESCLLPFPSTTPTPSSPPSTPKPSSATTSLTTTSSVIVPTPLPSRPPSPKPTSSMPTMAPTTIKPSTSSPTTIKPSAMPTRAPTMRPSSSFPTYSFSSSLTYQFGTNVSAPLGTYTIPLYTFKGLGIGMHSRRRLAVTPSPSAAPSSAKPTSKPSSTACPSSASPSSMKPSSAKPSSAKPTITASPSLSPSAINHWYLDIDIAQTFSAAANPGAFVSVLVGGTTLTYATQKCIPPSVAPSSFFRCVSNFNVTNLLSTANGGSINVKTFTTNLVAVNKASQYHGTSILYAKYTLSGSPESKAPSPAPTSRPLPRSTASVASVLLSFEAPFYSVFALTITVIVYVAWVISSQRENLYRVAPVEFLVYLAFLLGASLICEIFFASYVLASINTFQSVYDGNTFSNMKIIAGGILVSRLFHALPALAFLFTLRGPDSLTFHYKGLLDDEHFEAYPKTYWALTLFSFLDISFLRFIPWIRSPFSLACGGFPDLLMYRVCMYFKFAQSFATFGFALDYLAFYLTTKQPTDSSTVMVFLYCSFTAVCLNLFCVGFEISYRCSSASIATTQDLEMGGSSTRRNGPGDVEAMVNPMYATPEARATTASRRISVANSFKVEGGNALTRLSLSSPPSARASSVSTAAAAAASSSSAAEATTATTPTDTSVDGEKEITAMPKNFGFYQEAPKQQPAVRVMFDRYCSEESQTIDSKGLQALYYDLGAFKATAEITAKLRSEKIGDAASGLLSYEDFMVFWRTNEELSSVKISSPEAVLLAQVASIFRKRDITRNGFVEIGVFADVISDLIARGLLPSTQNLGDAMKNIEGASSGVVMLVNYLRWMKTPSLVFSSSSKRSSLSGPPLASVTAAPVVVVATTKTDQNEQVTKTTAPAVEAASATPKTAVAAPASVAAVADPSSALEVKDPEQEAREREEREKQEEAEALALSDALNAAAAARYEEEQRKLEEQMLLEEAAGSSAAATAPQAASSLPAQAVARKSTAATRLGFPAPKSATAGAEPTSPSSSEATAPAPAPAPAAAATVAARSKSIVKAPASSTTSATAAPTAAAGPPRPKLKPFNPIKPS